MAKSETIIKMRPEDHALLKTVLQYVAGDVSTDEMRAFLSIQGRDIGTRDGSRMDETVRDLAGMLHRMV